MKCRQTLAIIGLVVLSMVTIQAAEVQAVVASVSGTVSFKPPGGGGSQPLKKGQSLPIGSTVITDDDGVAVIVTTKGSAIQLGNSSVLKINELAFAQAGGSVTQRTAQLELDKGVVSALIDKSTPKVTDFKITTPQGAAAARGTFYAVLVFNGKTYIGVKEGHVAASSK